jgi:hypothetical protein
MRLLSSVIRILGRQAGTVKVFVLQSDLNSSKTIA